MIRSFCKGQDERKLRDWGTKKGCLRLSYTEGNTNVLLVTPM